LAKRWAWPRSVPWKPSATLRPTTISDVPGAEERPSMRRTCGRKLEAHGRQARDDHVGGRSLPFFEIWVRAMISFDTSGVPSVPRATCGSVSRSEACSRVTELCTSVWAAVRSSIALSSLPVDTSVFFSPRIQHQHTAANTNTTSAIPPP
jgi:hypothetical protein